MLPSGLTTAAKVGLLAAALLLLVASVEALAPPEARVDTCVVGRREGPAGLVKFRTISWKWQGSSKGEEQLAAEGDGFSVHAEVPILKVSTRSLSLANIHGPFTAKPPMTKVTLEAPPTAGICLSATKAKPDEDGREKPWTCYTTTEARKTGSGKASCTFWTYLHRPDPSIELWHKP